MRARAQSPMASLKFAVCLGAFVVAAAGCTSDSMPGGAGGASTGSGGKAGGTGGAPVAG
jgi:hypothetical protein